MGPQQARITPDSLYGALPPSHPRLRPRHQKDRCGQSLAEGEKIIQTERGARREGGGHPGGVDSMGKPERGARRPPAADAAAGAAAGAVSRLVLGPLDVVKIRLQVQLESGWNLGAPGAPKYRGMGHALATIFREEGLRGLWRGTVPGLLLTAPYCAVQFVALQQFRALAQARGLDDRKDLAVPLAFAGGAVAYTAARGMPSSASAGSTLSSAAMFASSSAIPASVTTSGSDGAPVVGCHRGRTAKQDATAHAHSGQTHHTPTRSGP